MRLGVALELAVDTPMLLTLVLHEDNVTFYRDLTLLGSAPMPRLLTDCYNSQARLPSHAPPSSRVAAARRSSPSAATRAALASVTPKVRESVTAITVPAVSQDMAVADLVTKQPRHLPGYLPRHLSRQKVAATETHRRRHQISVA